MKRSRGANERVIERGARSAEVKWNVMRLCYRDRDVSRLCYRDRDVSLPPLEAKRLKL